MSRRVSPSFTDYVVIAISPGLIMALVGSLVFFLIEVFYQGEYDQRLNFIMAMFVMAAVLIARIAIENGKDYALLFAIPLGLVTALATFRFVEFRGPLQSFSAVINLGLIGLIWWCANKLTWDSTVIDEAQDASGEGLLQTVGLDGDPSASSTSTANRDLQGTTGRSEPVLTPWQRFVRRRHRPHAPGVWVIYFSLAALPIFGFGNWFVPSGDVDGRRYVFKLLVVYVAAALGLLLTTSFLGLRRYLRQRRVEMPLEMAATWMGTGAAMIVGLLLICAFLPRRNSEYSVTDLPIFAGSPSDLWTTERAVGNEGQLDPEKADRTDQDQSGDEDSSSNSDSQNKGDGKKGSSDGSDGEGEKSDGENGAQGGKSDGKGKGKSANGKPSGGGAEKSNSEKSDNGGQDSGEDQSGDKESQADRGENQKQAGQRSKGKQQGDRRGNSEQQKDGSPGSDQQDQEEKKAESNPEAKQRRGKNNNQPRSTTKFNPSKIGSAIGGTFGRLLKFLYWLIVLAVIAFVVWRYHRQIFEAIQNFLASIRGFWNSLLARPEAGAAAHEVAPAAGPPPPPFSSFTDPFLTGMAQQRSPAEVVRYSFEAFQAWGRERGVARVPEQTPHEYARLIGQHESTISREATLLADLYCRCAYGREPASRSSIEHLRQLWERLRNG